MSKNSERIKVLAKGFVVDQSKERPHEIITWADISGDVEPEVTVALCRDHAHAAIINEIVTLACRLGHEVEELEQQLVNERTDMRHAEEAAYRRGKGEREVW